MPNPIFAALDLPTAEEALSLARQLAPHVGGAKIGSELFTGSGPAIVRELRATGTRVFLDLKFHDIPNTVARAVEQAVDLDVQMLTIHTSGGLDMMRAAVEAAESRALERGTPAPLILGVTVLTSLDTNRLNRIGFADDVARLVYRLAELAVEAGLKGLVCSPLEIAGLRQILPPEIQLVTPGIRPEADEADDQRRTLTPKEAMAAGADWLVIGRPIYRAPDPVQAAKAILESLELED